MTTTWLAILVFRRLVFWMGWWIALAGMQPPHSVRWNVWVILCVIGWNLAMIKMFDAWLYFKQSCVMTQEDFDFVCVCVFPVSCFLLFSLLSPPSTDDDGWLFGERARVPSSSKHFQKNTVNTTLGAVPISCFICRCNFFSFPSKSPGQYNTVVYKNVE